MSTKEVLYDLNSVVALQTGNVKKYRNEVVLTIWVEVGTVSTAMRDVKINAYRLELDSLTGITAEVTKDSVRATALWLEKKNVYVSDSTKIALPDPAILGVDQPGLLETIEKDGNASPHGVRAKDNTRYGYGSFSKYDNLPYYSGEDVLGGGRILFEFEIFPHDIVAQMSKHNITFDIGRRKQVIMQRYLDGRHQPDTTLSTQFPVLLDVSNDDPENFLNSNYGNFYDEDNVPQKYELYSFDSPSTLRNSKYSPSDTVNLVVDPITLREINFSEFARVSFSSKKLGGNSTLNGSRCSQKVAWLCSSADVLKYSLNKADPYNPDFQYSESAMPGNRVHSFPRFGNSIAGTDAVFDIKPIGGDDHAYILQYKLGDYFVLAYKNSNDIGWTPLGNTSTLVNGAWTFKDVSIRVDIYKGLKNFNVGDSYYFWVKTIPASILNKIKAK